MFFGLDTTTVNEKGEFRVPEGNNDIIVENAEYYVIVYPTEWNEGREYLAYIFEENEYFFRNAEIFGPYTVTEPYTLKVPEKYLETMHGDCFLIGNMRALELSKLPVEMLV